MSFRFPYKKNNYKIFIQWSKEWLKSDKKKKKNKLTK